MLIIHKTSFSTALLALFGRLMNSETLLLATITPQGSPFPIPITGAASVQLDDTFLVVGGWFEQGNSREYSDKIYKYQPATETWELLPLRLQEPAYAPIAFMVPASFPFCGNGGGATATSSTSLKLVWAILGMVHCFVKLA